MAVSRTLLRATAPAAASPAAALTRVSDLLVEDNTTNMFVTVFYGGLDVERGTLDYASGGHNPPLLVSPSGRVEPLPRVRGAALGMLPDQRFEDGRTTLGPEATLFLYTDGGPRRSTPRTRSSAPTACPPRWPPTPPMRRASCSRPCWPPSTTSPPASPSPMTSPASPSAGAEPYPTGCRWRGVPYQSVHS